MVIKTFSHLSLQQYLYTSLSIMWYKRLTAFVGVYRIMDQVLYGLAKGMVIGSYRLYNPFSWMGVKI